MQKDRPRFSADLIIPATYDSRHLSGPSTATYDINEVKRADEALCRRDAILEAVGFAAEKFLMATAWEQSLPEVLARLGEATGVSRVYVAEKAAVETGALSASRFYEWTDPRSGPQVDDQGFHPGYLEQGRFTRWAEILSQGQPVWGCAKELPEGEREALAAQQVRSTLVVPVFVDKAWWGLIGLDECWDDHQWSAAEISALKTVATSLGAAINRKRAEEELHAHQHYLALLKDITRTTAGALSLKEMLEVLAHRLGDLLGADICCIKLWDEARQAAIRAAVHGKPKESVPEMLRLPNGGGIFKAALLAGHGLAADDVLDSPYVSPDIVQRYPIRSMLGLPLIAGNQRLGVAFVSFKQLHHFTPEEIERGEQAAGQIALAVAKALLYRAEQQARKTAETLRAANLALAQTLDPDTVLETLLDHLAQLVPYDRANVMLLEGDSRLTVRALRGYEHWLCSGSKRHLTIDAGDYPHLQAVLTDQQSILIPDTDKSAGWNHFVWRDHVRSWLGVPLVAGGKVIGLYSLEKAERGFFTGEQLQLAEALAAGAAFAIQNARLFEQLRVGRERLKSLSHRLVEVQEAERRHIARELHDEVGQALTGLKLILEMVARSPIVNSGDTLREAQGLLNELLARVRDLSLDLRPAVLDDLGLVPALLWHFERYTTQTNVQVTFKHVGLEKRFQQEAEMAAYRIVQEALTNVARHARVNEVAVRLWASQDMLNVQVEDRGVGFDPEAALAEGASSGLTGMCERAALLGGRLTVESAPGAGARLMAELPLGNPLERRRSQG